MVEIFSENCDIFGKKGKKGGKRKNTMAFNNKGHTYYEVVVSEVPYYYTNDSILHMLKITYPQVNSVQRIASRATQKSTKFIRIRTFCRFTRDSILYEGVYLNGDYYGGEPLRNNPKVHRCWKCQAIAKCRMDSCVNNEKCAFCSLAHNTLEPESYEH